MKNATIGYEFHEADTRGLANHGWLVSRHSFSFADYYHPERVNFGALRVLNDDIVKAGRGFGTHPHENMEIISIPLSGSLAHKDSTGTEKEIKTGEVQVMSAGSGIYHSEYNYSKTDDVNFLQIWIMPDEMNIKPRYDQRDFSEQLKENKMVTVVSPEDKNALWINQKAEISMGHLKAGQNFNYKTKFEGNVIYAFLIEGKVNVSGAELQRRDAVGLQHIDEASVEVIEDAHLLMIEIPNIY